MEIVHNLILDNLSQNMLLYISSHCNLGGDSLIFFNINSISYQFLEKFGLIHKLRYFFRWLNFQSFFAAGFAIQQNNFGFCNTK